MPGGVSFVAVIEAVYKRAGVHTISLYLHLHLQRLIEDTTNRSRKALWSFALACEPDDVRTGAIRAITHGKERTPCTEGIASS